MLRTWFALVWDPQLMDWVATIPREQLIARLHDAAGLVASVAGLLVAFAALWTGPVVVLLYPASYAATIPLVPWIAFGAGVSALSLVAVATIIIAKQPRWCLPVYAIGLAANFAVGFYCVPRFGAAGAVAGVVSGEACIFACWVFVGKVRLKNLPLAWGTRVAVLAAAAVFVALYRPGFLGLGAPWLERLVLTLLIGGVLGVPLVRRLWTSRGEFFGSARS
jgi:O-antigen/teichoic acid export membrane protein